jgi:hypothetical protein
MTRKDFDLLAKEINKVLLSNREETAKDIAEAIMNVAEETNPRFDSVRFLKACGFGSEEHFAMLRGDGDK